MGGDDPVRPTAAMSIDGVLRREIGYQPIPEGIELYRVLAPYYNMVLLGDQDNPAYAADVEHFLDVEHIRSHSRVVLGPVGSMTTSGLRARQLYRLRNSGSQVAFVVEADPIVSARLFELGFNVMHFMHAKFTRPDWRPDYERETPSWDELVARETALKRMAA
jgi:hypothetical protein